MYNMCKKHRQAPLIFYIFEQMHTLPTFSFSSCFEIWRQAKGELRNHKAGTLLLCHNIKPLYFFPLVHKDNACGYYFRAIVSPCFEAVGESENDSINAKAIFSGGFFQIKRTSPPCIMANIPFCLECFSFTNQRKEGHEAHSADVIEWGFISWPMQLICNKIQSMHVHTFIWFSMSSFSHLVTCCGSQCGWRTN